MKEHTINGVRFAIGKLPALRSFTLLEYIRKTLADQDSTAGVDLSDPTISVVMLIKAVAGIPPENVEHVRNELFEFIQFWTKGVKGGGGVPLLGSEDMAFEELEPVHIYELIAEALKVNFTGSFSAIKSRFPAVAEITSLLGAQTFQTISQDLSSPDSASTQTSTDSH